MNTPEPFPREHFPTIDRLHTDVLELKYGPIHAVVLRHDNVRAARPGAERVREARLVDAGDVLRTYAVTFLTYDRTNEALLRIDDEIRGGGLIGKTFRAHGFRVKKNVIDVFLVDVPSWMRADFRSDSPRAKARLTEFYTKAGTTRPAVYGTVLEVYSPDFRDPADGIHAVDLAQVNPPTGVMQSAGIPADEIWSRLDRASETDEWDDLQEPYRLAQELAGPLVRILRHKVLAFLDERRRV